MNEKLINSIAFDCYSDVNNDFNPGKFAKLMTQECIKQCRIVQSQTLVGTNKDYDHGRDMGIEVCINAIKDHFGVDYELTRTV